MTSPCTLLPEVLQRQYHLANGNGASELDIGLVCGFSGEPPPPGKTMEEGSEQPMRYTEVSCKQDVQLVSEGLDTCINKCSVPENHPICRICHDGGAHEELLSPCTCSGSLATIHRSCLERWLSASGTSYCELCHYRFAIKRKSRSLLEWMRNPGLRQERRTLFGDMVCFLIISPLATISGWLCLRGAVDHLHLSSRLEAVGLITLTVALFTIYLFWTLVSLRYHCRLYREWRQSNQKAVLLLPKLHCEPSTLQHLQSSQQDKLLRKESMV